jgi:hypothetical protein
MFSQPLFFIYRSIFVFVLLYTLIVLYFTHSRKLLPPNNNYYYFLVGMPAEASNWSNITVVNLKNNKIADIGSLPAAWSQLERLYLGSNLLTTIPFEIGACVQVKELDFSWYEILVTCGVVCADCVLLVLVLVPRFVVCVFFVVFRWNTSQVLNETSLVMR